VSCLMCGNQNFTFPYIKTHNWLLECKSCRFRFSNWNSVERWQAKSNSEEPEQEAEIIQQVIEKQRLSFEKYLNEINKIATPKSLLIIGVHLKNTLEIAKERFQKVVAIEMDFVTAEQLYENQESLFENIEGLLKENKNYDLIMILDTIEKIEKPQKLLSKLQKIMHQRSLILVTSNNNDAAIAKAMKGKWYDLYKQNFYYFTLYNLNELFRKNDFETVLLIHEEKNLQIFFRNIIKVENLEKYLIGKGERSILLARLKTITIQKTYIRLGNDS